MIAWIALYVKAEVNTVAKVALSNQACHSSARVDRLEEPAPVVNTVVSIGAGLIVLEAI